MFNVRSFSIVESKFFINVSKENRKFIYGFMYLYSIQQSPPFRLVSNINIASKVAITFNSYPEDNFHRNDREES